MSQVMPETYMLLTWKVFLLCSKTICPKCFIK